jgi:hypothetical protein
MLKSVHHNPQKFGFNEETLRPFEQIIMKLEAVVMDGNVFNVSIKIDHIIIIEYYTYNKIIMVILINCNIFIIII